MKKCPKCGEKYEDEKDFCIKDGTALTFVYENDTPKELPHDMVYVEGGSLWLGDDSQNDNPRHKVTLDSFYISKYQVTQQLWNSVMSYDHSEHVGKNRPVGYRDAYNPYDRCSDGGFRLVCTAS